MTRGFGLYPGLGAPSPARLAFFPLKISTESFRGKCLFHCNTCACPALMHMVDAHHEPASQVSGDNRCNSGPSTLAEPVAVVEPHPDVPETQLTLPPWRPLLQLRVANSVAAPHHSQLEAGAVNPSA